MHTAHDRLFRYVFSEPEHARGLLAELVPSAVRDRIDWSTLRHLPGTFVAPELDQRHADVLFQVEIAGRPALLYVLLEHQSKPDPLMPLRVLGYAVRVMEQHLRKQPGPKRVPLVLPIVVHHGARGWTEARTFAEVLDAPAELLASLGPYLPSFELLIDDLAAIPEAELRRRQMTSLGTLTLLALQRLRGTSDVIAELRRLLDLAEKVLDAPRGTDAFAAVLSYILEVTNVARPELRELVRQLGPRGEEAIMSTADVIRAEGRAEGRVEGQAVERAEAVLRVLRVRGLAVSDEQRGRALACTDLEILARWLDRAEIAASAEDVFAG